MKRYPGAITLAMTLASGCAGARSTATLDANANAPPAEITLAAQASARPSSEPAQPSKQVELADLGVPSQVVCLLTADKWRRPPAFRLSNDGPAFATVDDIQHARVHVTADPVTTGLVMEVETGPVELFGVGAASELAVFANAALRLGGVLMPYGTTELHVTGTAGDKLQLSAIRTPIELTELTSKLVDDVACSGASLNATKLDVKATLGKALRTSRLVGIAIPLAASATGEPITKLVPTEGGARTVDLLEQGKASARIAWSLNDGIVTGWVPSASLSPAKPELGQGFGTGSGRLGDGSERPRERKVCDHDVALAAAVGDEAKFVGKIKAQATIELFPWAPLKIVDLGADSNEQPGSAKWVRVRVRKAGIKLLGGAKLFVRGDALKDCAQPASEP